MTIYTVTYPNGAYYRTNPAIKRTANLKTAFQTIDLKSAQLIAASTRGTVVTVASQLQEVR